MNMPAAKGVAKNRLIVARIVAVIMAFGWLLYSVRLVRTGWDTPFPHEFELSDQKIQQAIAWSVWTIATPLWFLFEYYLFNMAYPVPPQGELDKFKHNQQLSGKCWLAVAAILLALYFGHGMKP